MALTFDPFRDVDTLTSRLLSGSPATQQQRWMPMDLFRAGDHYVVNVDLPGVDPGSIDLHVDGGTLTVRAERTLVPDDADRWIARERPAGTFVRQLSLGDGLDVDAIDASYEHGVLTLTLPVAERAKPRRIEVRSAGGRDVVQGGVSG